MAKNAPPTKDAHRGPSTVEMQTATSAASRPTAHCVYNGQVKSIDPVNRTLNVRILKNVKLNDCAMMADSLAGILGFTKTSLPQPGTNVLVLYTPAQSYVLGGYGALLADPVDKPSDAATGDVNKEYLNEPAFGVRRGKAAGAKPGYNPSKDLLPGEEEFSNNMGVWLRLLTNLAQLSAGDLAKVEVSLVNDMVRITDNYFAHHNVGGDELIWSAAGKTTHEEHFTSYGFEADGKGDPSEQTVGEYRGNMADPSNLTDSDPFNATGRWRKSTYTGFLGDMIHTWISDPTKAISTYGEYSSRAGKYRCWVGSDGTLMINAQGGVHIEVSQDVTIPIVQHNWNDPNFDIDKAFENLDKRYLALWGNAKNDWEDMILACWQMRQYARYMTLWHSLARWRGLEKAGYCKFIPEGDPSTAAEATCSEADKEEINPDSRDPYTGRAVLSIDAAGNITLIADGNKTHSGTSSVVMSQGNVQVATSGNLELQCGGTFSVTAKNISMKATDHIELASIAGGLWLKARTAWNALCERGRIWLKSDAKPGEADPGPYPVQDGEGPKGEIDYDKYAIVLDASNGNTAVTGKEEVVVATTGTGSNVLIQAKEPGSNVSVSSDSGSVTLYSGSGMYIKSDQNIAMSSQVFSCDFSQAKMSDTLVIHQNGLEVEGFVRALQLVATNGVIGPNSNVFTYKEVEKATPQNADMLNAEAYTKATEALDAIPTTDPASTKVPITYTKDTDEITTAYMWEFPNWDKPAGDVLAWNTLKMSPVLDNLVTKNPEDKDQRPGANENMAWVDWYNCVLLGDSTTTNSSSCPWPGLWGKMWRAKSEAPILSKPAKAEDGDPGEGGKEGMEQTDYTFYVQKFSDAIN